MVRDVRFLIHDEYVRLRSSIYTAVAVTEVGKVLVTTGEDFMQEEWARFRTHYKNVADPARGYTPRRVRFYPGTPKGMLNAGYSFGERRPWWRRGRAGRPLRPGAPPDPSAADQASEGEPGAVEPRAGVPLSVTRPRAAPAAW